MRGMAPPGLRVQRSVVASRIHSCCSPSSGVKRSAWSHLRQPSRKETKCTSVQRMADMMSVEAGRRFLPVTTCTGGWEACDRRPRFLLGLGLSSGSGSAARVGVRGSGQGQWSGSGSRVGVRVRVRGRRHLPRELGTILGLPVESKKALRRLHSPTSLRGGTPSTSMMQASCSTSFSPGKSG